MALIFRCEIDGDEAARLAECLAGKTGCEPEGLSRYGTLFLGRLAAGADPQTHYVIGRFADCKEGESPSLAMGDVAVAAGYLVVDPEGASRARLGFLIANPIAPDGAYLADLALAPDVRP